MKNLSDSMKSCSTLRQGNRLNVFTNQGITVSPKDSEECEQINQMKKTQNTDNVIILSKQKKQQQQQSFIPNIRGETTQISE